MDFGWQILGGFDWLEQKRILAVEDILLTRQCDRNTAWLEVNMALEFTPSTTRDISIAIDPWQFRIDMENPSLCVGLALPENILYRFDKLKPRIGLRNKLLINISLREIKVSLNGKVETVSFSQLRRMTYINIAIPQGTRVCRIDLHTKRKPEQTCPRPKLASHRPRLEMSIDLSNDMFSTPFTPELLERFFHRIRLMNVENVNWIYHGNRFSGMWDHSGHDGLDEHIHATFHNLGDDLLAAAVEQAHANNMTITGVLRPLDMAIGGKTLPATAPDAQLFCHGKIVGGLPYRAMVFPGRNPHLCMQRDLLPQRPGKINKIVIASLQSIETAAEIKSSIEIYQSEDNHNYELYVGPRQLSVRGRRITFNNLDIDSEFIAIALPALAGKNKIRNKLDGLIKLYDEKGKEIEFTYGLDVRRKFFAETAPKSSSEPFVTAGFNFDCADLDYPSSVTCGQRVLNEIYSLDNSAGVLGIALDKNSHVPGMLNPAEPKAREYWLDITRQMLNTGVDSLGVDTRNHADILEWERYGFNQPLVEEFAKRYGGNPRNRPLSGLAVSRLRKLRGKFFTKFLHQAGELVKSSHRTFRLFMADTFVHLPDESNPMEIYFPWQKWIEEEICNEVVFAAINPMAYRGGLCRDLLELCHHRHMPVCYSTPIKTLADAIDSRQMIHDIMLSEFASFNIDQHAALLRYDTAGETHMLRPEIVNTLENWHKH